MFKIEASHFRNAAAVSACLLVLPLFLTLANPMSRLRGGSGGGFDWMPGSFAVMGALLFLVVLAIQLVASRISGAIARGAAIVAIVALFGLVWVELAVDAVSRAAALLT